MMMVVTEMTTKLMIDFQVDPFFILKNDLHQECFFFNFIFFIFSKNRFTGSSTTLVS